MRMYHSAIEAVKEIERELFEFGINNQSFSVQDLKVKDNPDYDSKELINYGYVLTEFGDINDIFDFFFSQEEAKNIRCYCQKELEERASGQSINPGEAWEFRRNYWQKFLHGGKFSYTYSERMFYQLYRVINELRHSPGSRQCVITIYDSPRDLSNWGGSGRIPCSLHYHFMRRKISGTYYIFMSYIMRSCDYYTHFPIDLWLGVNLGLYVSNQLGDKLHSFTHFIGSLHAFAKDFNKRRIF